MVLVLLCFRRAFARCEPGYQHSFFTYLFFAKRQGLYLCIKKTLARPDIRIRIRRSIIRIRINETVISPIIRIAAHEQGHR